MDNDNLVAPNDALAIINYLNGGEATAPNVFAAALYYDVNGDGVIAPNDALIVINHFNDPLLVDMSGDFEGEGPTLEDTIGLLAFDAAEQAQRRKRML